jgi:transposase
MRRLPFRRWIGSIRCCRFRRAAPSATDLNTTGTEPCRYAALDTATGRVHGKTAARHTSRDFVVFLKEVVALCPPDQQIHIILDNLSAHKTALVREFLEQHPRVRFHFTPTYSSWLNQVELWFAKIEREVIARGVFTSVPDLACKLRRYINAYSANAQPIYWKYSDPSHRIRSNELSATGH